MSVSIQNLIEQFFKEKVAHGLNLSVYQNHYWTHWTQGFGDDRKIQLTHEHFFDIASLTKTFTATLVLDTVQTNSRFRLGDSIGKYLSSWKEDFDRITLRHLLTHRSGLWRNFTKPKVQATSSAEFRKTFLNPNNYSLKNLGQTNYFDYNYLLLGHILEVVYQTPLDQILQNFLESYDLPEISCQPKCQVIATSQEVQPGIPHDEKARILQQPTGHAGLFATHRALLKWAELWLQNGFGFDRDIYEQAFGSKQNIPSLEVEDEIYGLIWRQGRYSQEYWNHAGFTGPAIFLEPHKQEAIVLTCSHLNVEDIEQQRQKYREWLRRLGNSQD